MMYISYTWLLGSSSFADNMAFYGFCSTDQFRQNVSGCLKDNKFLINVWLHSVLPAPQSRVFAFLLLTRAGGLGINLVTADTVIMYESTGARIMISR